MIKQQMTTMWMAAGAVATLAAVGARVEARTSVPPVEMSTSSGGGGSGSGTVETDANDGTPDCTTAMNNSPTDFERSVACAKLWGGHTFGAYYELGGGLTGTNALHDRWRFDAGLTVGLWIFGQDKVLYDASAFVERTDSGAFYGEAYLRIGDDDITAPDGSQLPATGTTDWHRTRSFWRPPTASYVVGPFRLSVQAEVAGTLGLIVTDDSAANLSVVAAPEGRLYAEATASIVVIDDSFFEAGVTGQLTLVEVALPFTGAARLTSAATDTYDFLFDVDLVVSTLSGTLTAWADLFGHKGSGHDATLTIADWDGVSQTLDVIAARRGVTSLH